MQIRNAVAPKRPANSEGREVSVSDDRAVVVNGRGLEIPKIRHLSIMPKDGISVPLLCFIRDFAIPADNIATIVHPNRLRNRFAQESAINQSPLIALESSQLPVLFRPSNAHDHPVVVDAGNVGPLAVERSQIDNAPVIRPKHRMIVLGRLRTVAHCQSRTVDAPSGAHVSRHIREISNLSILPKEAFSHDQPRVTNTLWLVPRAKVGNYEAWWVRGVVRHCEPRREANQ